MSNCAIPACNREAKYFMGWTDENKEKHWGLVCTTHDRFLGRKNLVSFGLTLDESIKFEKKESD